MEICRKGTCQKKQLMFLKSVFSTNTIFLNSPSGHYCSDDKQQRDKQTTCDTSSGFPREPVWFTDWQRRLKDQRDQRSKCPFPFYFFKMFCQEVVTLHPNKDRQRHFTPQVLNVFTSTFKCVFFGSC